MEFLEMDFSKTAALLVGILATGSLWYGCRDRDTSPTTTNTIRIGWAPVVGSLPLFVALEQGFFVQRNVVSEAIAFNSSDQLLTALVAGHIDMVPAISLVPIVHLEIKNPGEVRVFAVSQSTPDHASDSIIVKSDGHISTIDDLEGKRIGVFPGTSATNLLKAFLARRGVAIDHESFVPLSQSLQLPALESGAIDALFAYEPTTTVALASGRFREIYGAVYAHLLTPSPLGGAVIARSFERQNPDLSARAIEAMDDAVRFLRLNPEASRKLLPKFVGVSPELAQKVVVVESGLVSEMNLANVQDLLDLLYEVREINQRVEVERLTKRNNQR